jgi:hypothetical protein
MRLADRMVMHDNGSNHSVDEGGNPTCGLL